MLRFTIPLLVLLIGAPVLPGQAQPVYEWIHVPDLTPRPLYSGTTVNYALVWDGEEEHILAVADNDAFELEDNWVWDGNAWTNTGLQAQDDGEGLVYHAATGAVYRLQRTESLEPSNTWVFEPGVGWIQVDSDGPTSRTGFGWAYDASRQRTVLFGGSPLLGGPLPAYTWEWDGYDWTAYDTVDQGPDKRDNPAIVYDAKNEEIVLFGGEHTGRDTVYADTWTWDGTQWQRVATSGPSPRYGASMVYDSDRQKVLLFGGTPGNFEFLDDLWEWDGTSWTQIVGTAGPFARQDAGFVYDPVRQEAVLYSGYSGGEPPLPDVWRLQVREAWVDFAYDGTTETGDFSTPFNTLIEGVQDLPPEGKLFIKAGTTSETIAITKQLQVFTPLGPVIVGE
ncbi:MAG: hypothetical protein GVY18_17510 [Bacteroidetes bacterium]|jgi:hypothetical protein|nr:hypothetical protein [Bacteroidota bacterium]